jgi:hypothetical protein
MQTKLDKCLNKWNQLWSSSHLYIERLKCVEIVLTGLEEATTVVSEFELKLASYEELPSEVDALQAVSFMHASWKTTTTTTHWGSLKGGLSCDKLSFILLCSATSVPLVSVYTLYLIVFLVSLI